MKKLLSFFIAVMIFVSCLPISSFCAIAASPQKTSITDTETFEYLINKVEKETSPYIAARLRLLIYGDSVSNQYKVGSSFPSSSAYQTLKDGETGQRIALRSAQCYAYAEWAFYKFFGFSRYNASNEENYVWTHEEKSFTENNFKAALQSAKCGAHVRFANKVSGYQHSITFITHDEIGTGFYYLEGTGNGSGGYMVKLCHATYAAFAATYKNKKINYIQLPENYPESDSNSQLTVDNAKIPVNVKTGKVADIIGTTVISDCNITEITAGVYTSSGTEKFEIEVTPNCAAYRFGYVVDELFEFSSLSAGSYVYKLYAKDESGTEITVEEAFTVSSSDLQYKTETYYSYAVTPFDEVEYYTVNEDAHIHTVPKAEGEYTILKAGSVVQATGSHTEEDGTVWLQIGIKSWVKKGFFSSHTHTPSDTGLCSATGCEYDSTPKPTQITSAQFITNKELSVMSRPYTEESEVQTTLKLHTQLAVTAKVTNLKGELWYETAQGFVPASSLATVSSIKVTSLPKKTEYVIDSELDSTGIEVTVTISDGTSYTITSGMNFSYSFSTVGTSTVTVKYGGKSTAFTCTVKPVSGKETYKVTTDDGDPLNIREDATTDSDKAGQYANGAVITVTEITKADGYTWGKTDKGWVALEYCTYVSGYLYEIKFNLNGAEGEVSSIYKAYGKDALIPSDIPEREEYTFLGWSTSKTASSPDFTAGTAYTDEASATLYAVWQPDGTPLGGSISISGTAVYGNKLTLVTSKLTPADAEYSIAWLRDGAVISGATAASYALTKEDIGHSISVRITGKNDFEGTLTSSAVTAAKKTGAAASTPILSSATYSSITVKAVSGSEYSLNGSSWQSSNIFFNLKENTKYTVYIRYAETDTETAGKAASASFKTTVKIPTQLTSSEFSVNSTNKTVSSILEKTTVSNFIEAFGEKGFITVKTADGKAVDGDDYVGTGMKVVLGDGTTVTAEYTVIITGDINGDGKINVSDMVAVKAHILDTESIEQDKIASADVNGDGKVNVTDYISIKSHILEKSSITPRAV